MVIHASREGWTVCRHICYYLPLHNGSGNEIGKSIETWLCVQDVWEFIEQSSCDFLLQSCSHVEAAIEK